MWKALPLGASIACFIQVAIPEFLGKMTRTMSKRYGSTCMLETSVMQTKVHLLILYFMQACSYCSQTSAWSRWLEATCQYIWREFETQGPGHWEPYSQSQQAGKLARFLKKCASHRLLWTVSVICLLFLWDVVWVFLVHLYIMWLVAIGMTVNFDVALLMS